MYQLIHRKNIQISNACKSLNRIDCMDFGFYMYLQYSIDTCNCI